MNSRVKIVVFICAAVLLALFLWKSGKKRPTNITGDKKVEEDASGPSEAGRSGDPTAKESHEEVAEKQNLDYPEIKRGHVGLQTIPYKENAKNVRMLAIEVVPQPVCHIGDLEAIKALVGDEGSMLFTIEPMAGGDGSKNSLVASQRISVASLESGITADIALTDSPEGTYGIYLCSDNQRTGSCASKMAADYNQILSHNSARSDRDATFFYQMIVLAKPDAQLFNGTVKDLPTVRQELLRQGYSDDQLRKALKRTGATMNAVRSLPPSAAADGEGRKIVLPIAKLDRSPACN